MENRDIETKINRAFSHLASPDVLDSVLSECRNPINQEQKGQVLTMPKKKKSGQLVKWIAGIAAVFVLIAGSGLGIHSYHIHHTVASVISLDVNPSIEIKVNQEEKVLEVIAKNEDARVIIGDMDFRGSKLDITVNALIGSMLRNGYLSEIANSILVSVDSKDPAKGEALQQKLTEEINALLQTDTFTGSVLSQTVSASTELEQLAASYGITPGKAQLIQEIIHQDARYTFDDLAALSINELSLLHSSGAAALDTIDTVGSASDKAYIGEASAKAAALAHAGIAESDISRYEIEFDYEQGVMVYEIEFKANGYEYSYDIDATSGAVVKYETEWDDSSARPSSEGGNNTNHDKNNSDNHNNAANNSTEYSAPSSTGTDSYISTEEAVSIALNHAGLSVDRVYDMDCEFDMERGQAQYEVEFKADRYEYSYDINAVTGEIIKNKKERDD